MHLQQNLQRGQAGLGSSEDGEDSEAERGVAPVERPGRLHGLGDGAGGMLTALDISSGLAKGAWHFSQFNVWWAYLCYPADAVHVDEDGRHTLVDVTLNAGVAGLQPHEGERLQLLVFPKSRFKDSWDFAMALCTLYTMVIVPYRLCFFTPPGPFAEAFDRVIDRGVKSARHGPGGGEGGGRARKAPASQHSHNHFESHANTMLVCATAS